MEVNESFDLIDYLVGKDTSQTGLETDFDLSYLETGTPTTHCPSKSLESMLASPGSTSSGTSGDGASSLESVPTDGLLCPVCFSIPGRHYHYGAKVCVSCKGFFQRAVQGRKAATFRCQTGFRNCSIDSISKKSCKHCRFQKCLAAGMKPSLVRTPAHWRSTTSNSDTDENGSLKPKRKLDNKHTKSLVKQASLLTAFTEDETKTFKKLLTDNMQAGFVLWFKYFAANPRQFEECSKVFTEGKPMSFTLFNDFRTVDENMTKNIAFGLDDMLGLTPADKMTLIMANHKPICAMAFAAFTNLDEIVMYIQGLVEFGKANKEEDEAIRFMMEEMNMEEKLTPKVPLPPTSANPLDMFLEQVSQVYGSISGDYLRLSNLIQPWVRDKSNRLDDMVAIFLFFIMLFNPGSLNLEERSKVEKIQEQHLGHLYRYLRVKYKSEGAKRLHKALMILSLSEDLYRLHHPTPIR